MKLEEARKFMKLLGAKVPNSQTRAPQWLVCDCPLGPWRHDGGKSHADAFGVRIEPGDSFCNCFSCGFHGSQTELILELKVANKVRFHSKLAYAEALDLVTRAQEAADMALPDDPSLEDIVLGGALLRQLHVFPEWWMSTFPSVFGVAEAEAYLVKRGVDPQVAADLDLRFDAYQKRICFPIRDASGVALGLHGRAMQDGVEPRYRMYTQGKDPSDPAHKGYNNPIAWLGEQWVDTTKPICHVEGPFDLASVRRVYPNVVSPLFANPSAEKLKRMGGNEWFTLFDNGKGGDSGRKGYDKKAQGRSITHFQPPTHRKDPGVMTEDELRELLADYLD